MKRLVAAIMLSAVLVCPAASWAEMPMITDDTGTQGKGKFQVEVAGEHDRNHVESFGVTTREAGYGIVPVFTAGVTDTLDMFVGAPYLWNSWNDDTGNSSRVDGIGDTALGVKWRFFEKEGLSFALKPFVTLPSGNDTKGLGSGKVDYGMFFIASTGQEPWAVNFNLGYTRNLNTSGDRNDLWLVSAAAAYSLNKNWKLCADAGIRTNDDPASGTAPAYLLAGVIYLPTENLEFAIGVKQALNRAETDLAIIPGITYRF